jgi:hypothetical protein
MTFASFHAATPNMPGWARVEAFRFLPAEDQASCWVALQAESDRRNELERRDPLLYDEWPPPKRLSPHHGTPTSTSTDKGRVELPEHDDPLKRIPAAVYLPAIAGVDVSSSGRCRCPMPDHPDEHPSAKAYGTRWVCFSCGAKGDVIKLASEIYAIEGRGEGYWQLRDRIVEALDGAPMDPKEYR